MRVELYFFVKFTFNLVSLVSLDLLFEQIAHCNNWSTVGLTPSSKSVDMANRYDKTVFCFKQNRCQFPVRLVAISTQHLRCSINSTNES